MLLAQPLSISDPGKRENMEDYIFPQHGNASADDRLFIVCDGMGGHTKGEAASMLACEKFAVFFQEHGDKEITEPFLKEAFDFVQDRFDDYLKKNREARGMGTTAVLVYLTDNSAAVAHCGDSRCYHIRGHNLVWRTKDHKLVEEWVEKGYITARQALHHPKSNVITRAIQGAMISYTTPDVHFINDLKPGDYLFLCTDGVYEGIEDEELVETLASGATDEEKMESIYRTCYKKSKDNFSAFLLRIKE